MAAVEDVGDVALAGGVMTLGVTAGATGVAGIGVVGVEAAVVNWTAVG